MPSSLSATGILNSIACNTDTCLCWIIVLLNILTMFYLVFCSFYKVTKPIRIAGWVWCSADLTATVAILALHTCLFTILSTVFTALVLMAVLAVILPGACPKPETGAVTHKNKGNYVIYRVDEKNYCFALFEKSTKLLAKSVMCYNGIETAKEGIAVCRESGNGAPMQNLTEKWILEASHPKFELYSEAGKYGFRLMINESYTILKSDSFDDIRRCLNALKSARKAIGTETVYLAKDELLRYDSIVIDPFICGNASFEEEDYIIDADEIAEVSERATEIARSITVQEDVPDGVEVIGVIWPRSAGRDDKIYRYNPNNEKLQVGDTVLVPTLDTERVVGVALANHRVAPEMIKVPLKKIIRVVKRSTEKQ